MTINTVTYNDIKKYRERVLDWYDAHGRELPWRYKGDAVPDAYHVWLSEIMCQQTTVTAVIPYYQKFLSLWPDVFALADARQEDVMAAWAGLGYYARARNLHKCAQVVAHEMGGVFPDTQSALKDLPGIGDYTSAAIAAIVFDAPAVVMDGNIERIMARFFMIEDALPKAKPVFKAHTAQFFDGFDARHGDFAQSLMDIGSSICIPKTPKCEICPLHDGCAARDAGVAVNFPKKAKKKLRPSKIGKVYWIANDQGEILFHKRPSTGLLADMVGLPTTAWDVEGGAAVHPPCDISALPLVKHGEGVRHVFTHFDLTLEVYYCEAANLDFAGDSAYFWADGEVFSKKLPTVFQKVAKLML